MNLGEKIRELRIERGLLQRELSNKIYIAPNTLSQFESGKARPSYEVLVSLADFFEISVDYLLGREDDFGNITVQSTKTAPLPNNEQALLDNFRKLPVDLQHRASVYMQKLVEVIDDERYTAFPVKNPRSKQTTDKKIN